METQVAQDQQQQIPPADAPEQTQVEQPKGDMPGWVPKRLGELSAARKAAEERARAAEERAQAAEARWQQQQSDPEQEPQRQQYTQHPNVEQLAMMRAEQIANERVQQQQFTQTLQGIEKAGAEEFGDEFNRSIDNLRLAGIGGQEFLRVLGSVPNPHKVVQYLGQAANIEEAMRVASMDPVGMAVEMMKLSPKAAKAFAKPVSGAPAPITPIDGSGVSAGGEPAMGSPEWFNWRNSQARKKRG